MASLYVKDPKFADRVTAMARRLGTSKTETLRRAMNALERELSPVERTAVLRSKLDAYRAANPLPPATGLKADKAFFDEMWGEQPD